MSIVNLKQHAELQCIKDIKTWLIQSCTDLATRVYLIIYANCNLNLDIEIPFVFFSGLGIDR